MLIDVTTTEKHLTEPALTPVGRIESVWSIDVRLRDRQRTCVGHVRCQQAAQAERIGRAAIELAAELRLDQRGLDADTWTWWREAWAAPARSRDRAQLRALAGIDAAFWDLRERAPSERSAADARIYWSGFWLGATVDDARREAARASALGFDAVKMRCDVRDLGGTIARFDAVADELPDRMGIALELFGTGTVEFVTELARAIDTDRVLWLEDPLPSNDPAATARLAADLPVRLAGGEDQWGVDELERYVAAAGIAMPIVDFGCCGGPSALGAFLAVLDGRVDAVGVHLDATLATSAIAHLEPVRPVYVEVLDWWEHTTPSALRELLSSA